MGERADKADGQDADAYVTEAAVDAVLNEFGGDARAAVAALLHDLDALIRDYAAQVSYGFIRGEPPKVRR